MNVSMLCYKLTVDKHHFGALLKDQVCDATVCKCDSHQVFGFKAEDLYDVKNNCEWPQNYLNTLGHLCSTLRKCIVE